MENREQEIRQDREDLIEGRNAVAEAIRAGRTIDKIFVARGDTDRTLARILAKARGKRHRRHRVRPAQARFSQRHGRAPGHHRAGGNA